MVPIIDGISAKIGVVVGSRRTVNDDSAHDSVRVLVREMAMIPCRAKLCTQELVSARLARRKWALRHTVGAVHLVRLPLTQAMPVDAGAICGKIVFNSNPELVAPVRSDGRSRILAVDGIDGSSKTIWC